MYNCWAKSGNYVDKCEMVGQVGSRMILRRICSLTDGTRPSHWQSYMAITQTSGLNNVHTVHPPVKPATQDVLQVGRWTGCHSGCMLGKRDGQKDEGIGSATHGGHPASRWYCQLTTGCTQTVVRVATLDRWCIPHYTETWHPSLPAAVPGNKAFAALSICGLVYPLPTPAM